MGWILVRSKTFQTTTNNYYYKIVVIWIQSPSIAACCSTSMSSDEYSLPSDNDENCNGDLFQGNTSYY